MKGLIITQPHQVWCSDLSRIVYRGTIWYLATIEDVATRQIVAGPARQNAMTVTSYVFDLEAGTIMHEISAAAAGTLHAVALSQDASLIATGGEDNVICIWNVDTGQQVGTDLAGHNDWVMDLAFSPDGALLVSGSMDTSILFWKMDDLAASAEPLPSGHSAGVMSLAFSSDGTLLVSGGRDATLLLWDTQVRFFGWPSNARARKLDYGCCV